MRSLIEFIVRYHFGVLFLIMQGLALTIVVSNSYDKKAKTINSAMAISGYVQQKLSSVSNFIALDRENQRLNQQIAELNNRNLSYYKLNHTTFSLVTDSIFKQKYRFYSAQVINNSVNKNHNYLTLNIGSAQGAKVDMGVISSENNSLVGIVRDVSLNYASVISILNLKLGISAKVKRNRYVGSIAWDGQDYTTVRLKEIPNHVDLIQGDTIVTSGYSPIFPEGLLIGTISEFHKNTSGSFYDIKVKLATNFKSISSVNLVENVLKDEQLLLEQKIDSE